MLWAWHSRLNIKCMKVKYAERRRACLWHRSGCTPEEFEELVQRNMAANCGVDFEEFCQLLLCMTEMEIGLLQTSEKLKWRCIFNLHRIRGALEILLPYMPAGDNEAERDPNAGAGADRTPGTELGLADLAILRNHSGLAKQCNIIVFLNIVQRAISEGMSRPEDNQQ